MIIDIVKKTYTVIFINYSPTLEQFIKKFTKPEPKNYIGCLMVLVLKLLKNYALEDSLTIILRVRILYQSYVHYLSVNHLMVTINLTNSLAKEEFW